MFSTSFGFEVQFDLFVFLSLGKTFLHWFVTNIHRISSFALASKRKVARRKDWSPWSPRGSRTAQAERRRSCSSFVVFGFCFWKKNPKKWPGGPVEVVFLVVFFFWGLRRWNMNRCLLLFHQNQMISRTSRGRSSPHALFQLVAVVSWNEKSWVRLTTPNWTFEAEPTKTPPKKLEKSLSESCKNQNYPTLLECFGCFKPTESRGLTSPSQRRETGSRWRLAREHPGRCRSDVTSRGERGAFIFAFLQLHSNLGKTKKHQKVQLTEK